MDFEDEGVVSLRRLELGSGRRFEAAAGSADLDEDQMPMVWSAEAERMREVGVSTARWSMDAVWPYSSRTGEKEADVEGESESW